jgi:hypothetical protein
VEEPDWNPWIILQPDSRQASIGVVEVYFIPSEKPIARTNSPFRQNPPSPLARQADLASNQVESPSDFGTSATPGG